MPSRSGACRSVIQFRVMFLDSERQNDYVSIADCLGDKSLLDKPFPLLELDAGDLLLTVDDKDVRNKPRQDIKELIESLTINVQKDDSEREKNLLYFTYVKAKDKLENHLTDLVVIIFLFKFSKTLELCSTLLFGKLLEKSISFVDYIKD